jgi:arsenate reductase-like glutaredoxin family protein
MNVATEVIRVYWQPGCTSCLRTKEFLTRYDIPFESRNVLGDPNAFEELAEFGLRQVPIVTKGKKWANGQVLKDVADLVGIQGINLNMLHQFSLFLDFKKSVASRFDVF